MSDIAIIAHADQKSRHLMAKRFRIQQTLFILFFFMLPTAAYGMASASDEQLLCTASHIVVAEVENVIGSRCSFRLDGTTCSNQDEVTLSLKIKKLLAVKQDTDVKLTADDTVSVNIRIDNQLRNTGVNPDVPAAYRDMHIIPPMGTSLADEDLNNIFKNKQFVFSINTKTSHPYWAFIWDLSLKGWAKYTSLYYKDPNCPKLVKDIPNRPDDRQVMVFDSGSDLISDENQDYLDWVGSWLKRFFGTKVTIKAFADEEKTESQNLNLAELRATAIKSYLTAKGIDPSRIRTVACIRRSDEKGLCYTPKPVPKHSAYFLVD